MDIKKLKDLDTGVPFLPLTSFEAVRDANGNTLGAYLNGKQDKDLLINLSVNDNVYSSSLTNAYDTVTQALSNGRRVWAMFKGQPYELNAKLTYSPYSYFFARIEGRTEYHLTLKKDSSTSADVWSYDGNTLERDGLKIASTWQSDTSHYPSTKACDDRFLAFEDVEETTVPEFGLLTYNEQALTDEQKAQARTNIGAASSGDLNSKQDVISDLANIRSGASKGATALQSVPSTYRTAAQQDAIHDSTKADASALSALDTRVQALEADYATALNLL